MKIILSLFAFCLLSLISVEASDFQIINYKVVKDDSFSRILRKFLKDDSIINANSPSVRETIKANPNLNNKEVWMKPPLGIVINLKIEKSLIDTEKMKKYLDSLKPALMELRPNEYVSDKNSVDKKWKGSLFYMASIGDFKQTSNRFSGVNYQQNSFFSMGASFSYLPELSSLWSYSTSLYISTLKTTGSNLNNDQISVPNEIGASLYVERFAPTYQIITYAGLDYDSFSTFNLAGVTNEERIYVDKNAVYYFTLGLSKKIDFFEASYFTKIALSKSILSTYESSYANSAGEEDKLSGFKAMFYLNRKFSKNFYFHSLIKYHSMESSFDLSVLRIGVGVGYILF